MADNVIAIVNNLHNNRDCDPALCHLQIVLVPLNGRISYFGILYSCLTHLRDWIAHTIDFVLNCGDVTYRNVRHSQTYFDYTELPITVSAPPDNYILSSQFGTHEWFFACTAFYAVIILFC